MTSRATPKGRHAAAPRANAIVAAQWLVVANLPNRSHNPANVACWACGYVDQSEEPRPLFKAHIQAVGAGGDNDPTNYFLLCGPCHDEQPDGASLKAQLLWLVTHESYIDRLARLSAHANRAASLLRYVAPDALDGWIEQASDELSASTDPIYTFGFRNTRANERWSIVEAMLQWVERRQQ